MQKKDYINGMKGLGALIIATYHIIGIIGLPNGKNVFVKIITLISQIGYIPVEMFFFFSGFLMVYNYSKKIKSIDCLDYIKNKFIKLLPLLLISILFCVIFYISNNAPISIYQIFYNIFLFQGGLFIGNGDYRIDIVGNGTWFLTPLIISYILFYYIFRNNKKENAFGISLAIVLLSIITLKNYFNYPILNGYMARGFLAFFSGTIFYLIFEKYKLNKASLSLKIYSIIMIILYFVIILKGDYKETVDFIIFTDIFILPSILLICENFEKVSRFLSNFIFKKLNDISMILFFLNIPIAYFFKTLIVENFKINIWFSYGLYLIILIIISYLILFLMRKLNKIK